MPVEENDRGTFLFNSKDLCMIEHIPELMEAGIDSFKVEGRMKSALYVASVGRTYRMAIDDYLKDPQLYRDRLDFYRAEISKCTYREYTTGFFFGKPDKSAQIYDASTYVKDWTYLGMADGEQTYTDKEGRVYYLLEQKNKFCKGDRIEIMKPDGRDIPVVVAAIYDSEGQAKDSAPHPKEILDLDLRPENDPTLPAEVETGDILRVVMKEKGEDN